MLCDLLSSGVAKLRIVGERNNSEVWAHSRNDVILNAPHHEAVIQAELCFGTYTRDNYFFELQGPKGIIKSKSLSQSEFFINFTHQLLPDSEEGLYVLTIWTPYEKIEEKFSVNYYDGPTIGFEVSEDQNIITREDFSRSIDVRADEEIVTLFSKFSPSSTLEVGIYEVNSEETQQKLIDAWQVQTDPSGTYKQPLLFPSDLPSGEYIIAACDINDCGVTFNLHPLYDFPSIFPPAIYWQHVRLQKPYAGSFKRCESANSCTITSDLVDEYIPGGTKQAYFQWDYKHIPKGAKYTRTWSVPNKGTWVRYECDWNGPESGIQRVTLREPGGLYSGEWELTIEVNGQEILQEQVTVDGNWDYWAPITQVLKTCD